MLGSRSFLGASTKTYRSYGKRKNNTTNKGAYALWDSSPETSNRTNLLANSSAPTAPRRSLNSPSSSSSTSLSSDEDSPPPKPARMQILTATKPSHAARNKPAGAVTDKENNSSPFEGSPRRPVFNKAKSRMVLHSPVKSRRGKPALKAQDSSAEDDSDAPKPAPIQRQPLKPRFLGVEILVPTKKPSPLRAEVQRPELDEDAESSEDFEAPVVRPSRRRGKAAKVQESSEEGDATPFEVVLEVPVKSGRSSGRSSKSRVSVESAAEEPVRLSLRSRAKKAATENVAEEEEDELEESSGPTLEDPEEEEEEEDQLASSDDDELESEEAGDPLSAIRPSSHGFPALLDPLLSATNQSHPLDFTSFISSPPSPFSPTTSISRAASRWTKIGEASYSEVFEREGIVVKIIPVAGKEVDELEGSAEEEAEVPYSSDWASVEREIEISKLVGGEEDAVEGFVEFKG